MNRPRIIAYLGCVLAAGFFLSPSPLAAQGGGTANATIIELVES